MRPFQVQRQQPQQKDRIQFSFPHTDRKGKGRIALIGHSAGGWISRVYLSNRNYGGRSYNGSELVHSLMTLESPNANAPGAAFKSIEWINREDIPDTVRALAVAGKGFQGGSMWNFYQECI
ncbi:hypothetical protein CTEN210_06273 [Chaetoceros tenuissimus]|uniref:GPI inositol-deacylase n=1 Tax=Chaetoceros tenuissimus TaxID=426638 RepID=A0AAD3CPJ3_9STRA|nr:hypothetical protein CTEN210_06273 [Chaetoceros tenuissimus]